MEFDNNEWYLLTNFEKKYVEHIKMSCVYANVSKSDYKIEETAYDANGNLLSNHSALFVKKHIYYSENNNIFDASFQLQEVYKEMLLSAGLITQDFADTHLCYLGIEKEYGIDISALSKNYTEK